MTDPRHGDEHGAAGAHSTHNRAPIDSEIDVRRAIEVATSFSSVVYIVALALMVRS